MCAVEVIELNVEIAKILYEFRRYFFCQFCRRYIQLPRLEHDGCAMRVRGAHVDTMVATQFLEPNPNVSLQVLDKVPHMDRAIGVGQSTGDENFALFVRHFGVALALSLGAIMPWQDGLIRCL